MRGDLFEVLWSDAREIETVSTMDQKQKNCRESEGSQKRHGVRDRERER